MQQTTTDQLSDLEPLLSLLKQKEIQSSLINALEKLPGLVNQYSALERTINFIQSVINDKESLEYIFDRLEKDLQPYILNKDSLEAFFSLVESLPKYVKYLSLIEPIIDFILSVSNDKESVDYLFEGVQEVTEPIQQKVQNGWTILQKAKKEAERARTPVTIFTVIKLMKEPAVQQGLHFAKALLTITSEYKQK
ncbi:hypothetical protein [Priestia abyssalis]|uniref:hypothetical protein n=1 Tax=Priestia abyssalis TaxID=1221450 RepID=UPI000994CCBF|nr:hypothetical protein [Priestia abyssalis]